MRLLSLLLCSLLLFPTIGFAQPGGGIGGNPPPTITAISMNFDLTGVPPHGEVIQFSDPVNDRLSDDTRAEFVVSFVPSDPNDYLGDINDILTNFTVSFCQNSELHANQWNLFHSEALTSLNTQYTVNDLGTGVIEVTFAYRFRPEDRTLHHEMTGEDLYDDFNDFDLYAYVNYAGTMVGGLNVQLNSLPVVIARPEDYEACIEFDLNELSISGSTNSWPEDERELTRLNLDYLHFKIKRPDYYSGSNYSDWYDDKYVRFTLTRISTIIMMVDGYQTPVVSYETIRLSEPVSVKEIIDDTYDWDFGTTWTWSDCDEFISSEPEHSYCLSLGLINDDILCPYTLGKAEFTVDFDENEVDITYQTRVTNPDY